jgi:hypothetical protein
MTDERDEAQRTIAALSRKLGLAMSQIEDAKRALGV